MGQFIFGLCLPANVFLVRFNCFPYKVYGRMCLYDMISAPIILFLPSVNGAVCGVWTKVWADRRKVLVAKWMIYGQNACVI